MSTIKKNQGSPCLCPLPLPDVVHTTSPLLPAPVKVAGGRCFCCGADVKHRFLMPESLPLTRLAETAEDSLIRLDRARDTLQRLGSRQPPQDVAEQAKYRKALRDADTSLQHATLASRRLALRHIPAHMVTGSEPMSETEHAELNQLTPPFHLCYLCHAWHALNGFAAAQGCMAWFPDLHPRSVVSLNRKALQAIFSGIPTVIKEGRKVLTELLRHRLPLEERFGGWRPADFAEALHRYPPSMRDEMREKMTGVALVLTPDSVTDREDICSMP